MTRTFAVVPLVLALGLVLGLDRSADAETHASPLIDRTLRCTTGIQAGVREMYIEAQAGFRSPEKPGTWKWLPSVEVTTPGVARGPEQWILGAISAGSPLETNADVGGVVSVGIGRCKAVRVQVPLRSAGLARQAVGQLGERFQCVVPQRILLRVRGAFESDVALLRNPFGYLSSNGIARSGSLAVRSESGKPIVFATVDQSGAARVFTAKTCVPD